LLPGLITFDDAARIFTIDRAAIVTTITYTLKVTGTLEVSGNTNTTIFDVLIKACDTTAITMPILGL